MNSRERMLCVLNNGRPDRLPCQVHSWMDYYLKNYLNGMDTWQAYEKFGMDYAIYAQPKYRYRDSDLAKWRREKVDLGVCKDGNQSTRISIHTPRGSLHKTIVKTPITTYDSEHLIKNEADFNLWNEFYPIPMDIDFSELQTLKEKLGDKGIIRVTPFSPGQGSPWQSFCTLHGTEEAILLGMDEPKILHHMLDSILQKTLKACSMWEGIPADLVEVGGGAGSSTVISPDFYREFGLTYDQQQNKLFHEVNLKVVNHFCGGLMPMLDLVIESGADGLETMTPSSMGGDCDLRKASEQVGRDLFFIGGFDQNSGFENGTAEKSRSQVFECFEATKNEAGYLLCPSDHFFHGDPACLQAFSDAAKECVY